MPFCTSSWEKARLYGRYANELSVVYVTTIIWRTLECPSRPKPRHGWPVEVFIIYSVLSLSLADSKIVLTVVEIGASVLIFGP